MRFSIIVPAFNAEKNIQTTILSLSNQTYDKKDFEIIVVNDGSTDGTLNIVTDLKRNLSNLIVIDKQNGGVSSARNCGIKNASGEYLLFVDADDTISENALTVIDEFLKQNKNIKILTYNIMYSNGTCHWRKEYLKKTGVYDSETYCFANLTTINICVKKEENPELNFNEKHAIHEDEEFSARIVSKYKKFGFVAEATYFYRNDNSESVMNTRLNPFYSFDSAFEIYMELLDMLKSEHSKPTRYIQSLIINDLSWKLRGNCLYSLNEEKRLVQQRQVQGLLKNIDNDIILNHPNIDLFHKQYFLKLKKAPIQIKTEGVKLIEQIDEINIHIKENHLYISKVELSIPEGNLIHIEGFFKNYISDYVDKRQIKLFAIVNDKTTYECKKKDTYFSYHRSNTKTNDFIGFDLLLPINIDELFFVVSIFGICYKINRISFKSYILREKLTLHLKRQTRELWLQFDKSSSKFYNKKNPLEKCAAIVDDYLYTAQRSRCKALFKFVCTLTPSRYIIYSDREGVFDNALRLFLKHQSDNDTQHIIRLYVYHSQKDKEELIKKYNIPRKNLVEFHSLYHQIAYANAICIYTSFVDSNFYLPFGQINYKAFYSNIYRPEIVYLQHGVLHAISLHYAAEFLDIDKITIATYQEESYLKKLGFSDCQLIKTGLERFKALDKSNLSIPDDIRSVLYIPSWRSYLAKRSPDNTWHPNDKKFYQSTYWKNLNEWNSEDFIEFVEKSGIKIDVQLHPIFANLDISFQSKNISIKREANISDYDLIVTDYSSIVYDAVYLGKPIVYYCPDYVEFTSGLNLYCDTLVKMKDGFGPFTQTTKELLEMLKIIKKNKSILLPFAKKYQSTFLPF